MTQNILSTVPFSNILEKELNEDSTLKLWFDEQQLNTTYAIAVVELRNKLNLSQKDLANLLGTSQSVISRIENRNCRPTLKMLNRISKVTDTKLNISFQD